MYLEVIVFGCIEVLFMPHKRSVSGQQKQYLRLSEFQTIIVEARKAMQDRKVARFCREHSFYDSELRELVFLRHPEDTERFVKIALGDQAVLDDAVLDTPQGLVLSNPQGTGAFQ
jgi:hypothetical protein